MKKLPILILTGALVLSLAACSGTATTTSPSKEPAAASNTQQPAPSASPADGTYPQLTGETGTYKAGVYETTATGIGGDIVFHVTFSKDAITSIEAVTEHETEGVGSRALDNVIPAIIKAQSTDVDGWSGATVTSTAIKDGVNAAIEAAKA